MTVNYPDIIIHDFPNIEDKEVRYWIREVSELRTPLLKLFENLFNHSESNNILIATVCAILKRQLEISESILLLVSKGKIRDSGILILNAYELALDLQYMSLSPGYPEIWITHQKESQKPWRVSDQIKAVFTTQSEYEAEKKMYKSYSMIKHGNVAGEHLTFDLFMKDNKLPLAIIEPSFILVNLFPIGFLLNRTFVASIKILNDLEFQKRDIEIQMKNLYDRFYQNWKTLTQLRVIELMHPTDIDKQMEIVKTLKLSFDSKQ